MAEYVLGKDLKGIGGFFKRFTKGKTAAQVDAEQTLNARNYTTSYGQLEQEYQTALLNPNIPEGAMFDSKESWDQFRKTEIERMANSPYSFEFSKKIKVLGQDRVLGRMPANIAEEALASEFDNPREAKRFDLASTLQTLYTDTDGSDKVDPQVRTSTIGEDGGVNARTNNLTATGASQNETNDEGIGGISLAQLDAIIEADRIIKQQATGGKIDDITRGFNRAAYSENALNSILGTSRSDTIAGITSAAEVLKNQGYTITNLSDSQEVTTETKGEETRRGTRVDTSLNVVPTEDSNLQTEKIQYASYTVDPTSPSVLSAKDLAMNYDSGTVLSPEEIDTLVQGLSFGFQGSARNQLTFNNNVLQKLNLKLAEAKRKDPDSKTVERLEQQIAKFGANTDKVMQKIIANIESDAASRADSEQKVATKVGEDIKNKLDLVASGNFSDDALKLQNDTLTKDVRSLTALKFKNLTEDKAKLAKQILGSNKNILQLTKSPEVFNDLTNLSGEEFLAKYSNTDGTLNTTALYGNDFSPAAVAVLDKTVSKAQVDALDKAIKEGNKTEVDRLIKEINLSEKDSAVLAKELQNTGGDFRGSFAADPRNSRFRAMYFAMLSELPIDGEQYKTLTETNGIYANIVEMGMLNASGLNNALAMEEQMVQNANATKISGEASDLNKRYLDLRDDILNGEKDLNDNLPQLQEINEQLRLEAKRTNNASTYSLYINNRANVIKQVAGERLQPRWWQELFTLGFAEGMDSRSLSPEVPVDVVTNDAGEIVGFRANNAFREITPLIRELGDDFVRDLAAFALEFTKGKQLNINDIPQS